VRAALVAVAALCLAGGPVTARDSCPAGLHPATTAELFFGADIPGGGQISDADWRDFLNSEVTPRFPEGLTTWDASGQWRAPGGAMTRERSRVLLLVLSGRSAERAKLRALIDAYKSRFHQLSVLLVEHRDCAEY